MRDSIGIYMLGWVATMVVLFGGATAIGLLTEDVGWSVKTAYTEWRSMTCRTVAFGAYGPEFECVPDEFVTYGIVKLP